VTSDGLCDRGGREPIAKRSSAFCEEARPHLQERIGKPELKDRNREIRRALQGQSVDALSEE
jgi:hypothetical protein